MSAHDGQCRYLACRMRSAAACGVVAVGFRRTSRAQPPFITCECVSATSSGPAPCPAGVVAMLADCCKFAEAALVPTPGMQGLLAMHTTHVQATYSSGFLICKHTCGALRRKTSSQALGLRCCSAMHPQSFKHELDGLRDLVGWGTGRACGSEAAL